MASSSRDTRLSEQYAINRSMDLTFDKLGTVIMGYEPTGGTLHRVKVNSDGELMINLETADIEIGAVEIKDGTSDVRTVVDSTGLNVNVVSSLVPSKYDYIALTYVAAGNGAGEVETATFKTGGSGGTTVATVTLTYDASDNIATVTKA